MDFEAQAREDVELTLREGRASLDRSVALGRLVIFGLLAVLAGLIVGIRERQPWPALVFGLDTIYAFWVWRRVRQTGEHSPRTVLAIAHLDPLFVTASAMFLRWCMPPGDTIHGLPLAAIFDIYGLAPAFMLVLFLGCMRLEGSLSRWGLSFYSVALYGVAIRWDVGEFMPPQILAGVLIFAGGFFGSKVADRIGELLNRQARLTLLRRYVPQPLVDKVSSDSIDLKTLMVPQAIEVTMLVADLRGFTAMSEKMTPEEVVAMLGEYHTAMLGAVEASGGIVDKFLGDGILVVFGLPSGPGAGTPPDQGASSAVQCAAAMLFRLGVLNATRAGAGKPALAMGIGIHTGPVLAGTIGAGARREFTVIGDAVNTASRLEGLTKTAPSPVLVSAATVSRLGGGVASNLRELEAMPIRGKSEPLRIYALERGSGLLRMPRPA